MNCPADMPPDGKRFWARYHDHLVTDEVDYPNFEMLCRNWALLKSIDPTTDPKAAILYMALNKHILAQQKALGAASKKPKEAVEESLGDVLRKALDG